MVRFDCILFQKSLDEELDSILENRSAVDAKIESVQKLMYV